MWSLFPGLWNVLSDLWAGGVQADQAVKIDSFEASAFARRIFSGHR
jgi:hypothetical protein